MGTRRIVIGQIGGQMDCRMSRPGYWADLDDVNDRKKISFAASRPAFGEVAEAGFIAAPNSWVNLTTAFGSIPPVLFAIKRGGVQVTGEITRLQSPTASYANATPYVVVVEAGRVMVTSPVGWLVGIPAGDQFNFFCVR